MDPLKLKEVVLNVRSPIIIKKLKIPWKCFDMTLEQWCSTLESEIDAKSSGIVFEVAKKKHFNCQQWEKFRNEKEIKMKEFLEEKSDFFKENWACLSYRNILELPKALREDINFAFFGFPGIKIEDTTFWLNSRGCNTPCHYDTYGCNVVVQVFGKKSWMLFPPNCSLKPVRVPYEESSVYCSQNFYSPNNLKEFAELKENCFQCTLSAGDVLVVPKNWWHYVESLETSLSFNHWIPLETDAKSQLDECIVKYVIERCMATENELTIGNFLNPNQITSLVEESEILSILEKLCNQITQKKKEPEFDEPIQKKNQVQNYPYMYLTEEQTVTAVKNTKCNIEYVHNISAHDFVQLMEINSLRFDVNMEKEQQFRINKDKSFKEMFINVMCNPNIINSIKNLLIENYKKSN